MFRDSSERGEEKEEQVGDLAEGFGKRCVRWSEPKESLMEEQVTGTMMTSGAIACSSDRLTVLLAKNTNMHPLQEQ